MDDGTGFTAFVEARGPSLLRFAWLLTADADSAQDLVQEALVRVVPGWGRIAPEAREAYVRTTIRRVWVDGWRRRRGFHVLSVAEPPEPEEPGSGPDAADDRLTVQQALARLAPRQRAVLVLRFYEDLTERQTAEALGITIGTVKSQTRHALDRLRVLAPDLAEAFGRTQEVSA
jgi:RNA polymerase sigma-70 factor (sigma-E family)